MKIIVTGFFFDTNAGMKKKTLKFQEILYCGQRLIFHFLFKFKEVKFLKVSLQINYRSLIIKRKFHNLENKKKDKVKKHLFCESIKAFA